MPVCYDDAQIFNGILVKGTFLRLKIEVVVLETVEDFMDTGMEGREVVMED